MAKGSAGLVAIVDAFGAEMLAADGTLDRQKLGAMVFDNPAQRRRLEAIIHPLVLETSQAQFAALSRGGAALVVYESALLFESKRHLDMAGAIRVTASEATRIARVQARDGCTADEVRARMRAQMDEAEKRQLSDYILDNSGDLEALRLQVEQLVETLKTDATGG